MRMKPAVSVSMVVVWSALCLCMAALAMAVPVSARGQVAVPALTSPVVDTTGTLTQAQVAQLERQSLDLQRRKGSQLQILIVSSTQPEDTATYAQRVFDTWQLGRRGKDDGVLLLVALDDRRARIHVGSGLERVVSNAAAGRIIQTALVPRLSAGDVHGGIAEASKRLAQRIEGGRREAQLVQEGALWMRILFGASMFVAGVLCIGLFLFSVLWMLRSGTSQAKQEPPKQYLFRDTLVEGNPNARPRPRPEFSDGDDDRYFPHSSGSGTSSGGWSGGGGRSGGGGASGGW